jgi:hypothetical protein
VNFGLSRRATAGKTSGKNRAKRTRIRCVLPCPIARCLPFKRKGPSACRFALTALRLPVSLLWSFVEQNRDPRPEGGPGFTKHPGLVGSSRSFARYASIALGVKCRRRSFAGAAWL